MSYKSGQWYAICDVCGFKFLSGQLRERWDGLMVDSACFETRHPQEFIKAVRESTVPWTSVEGEGINGSPNEYVDANYFQAYDSDTGLPGEYVNRLGIT